MPGRSLIIFGATNTVRITNSILQRTALAGIQQNLRDIQDATDRAVSGTRIRAASDDPGVAGTVMRTDSRLRALDQYQRNIGSARSRLAMEESVLDQVTDLLSRARELAMRESGGAANAMTREITRAEVDQLLETAIQLGNTQLDGLYLFGGDYADQPAIVINADGTISTPPAGDPASPSRQAEVAAGQLVRTNHDAREIFGDDTSGVIAALRALSEALGNDDGAAVGAAGAEAGAALDQIQVLLGDVGARVIRLDIAEANIEALDTNLRTFRSDLTEVEFEEALTELIGRQTALQAAFVATSRIIQTTLTDYLR
jgi:flagellar hook-associated protein 3 FlgL